MEKVLTENRRAKHDYHVQETLVAGLILEGWEVKSIKAGRANISQSYVTVMDDGAFLLGANISPLPNVGIFTNPSSERTRKLLLTKKEIDWLSEKVRVSRYTAIPLNLHISSRGRIKLVIGLAKGKRQHDKREDARNRDADMKARYAAKGGIIVE